MQVGDSAQREIIQKAVLAAPPPKMNLLDLIMKGGVLMIPIGLLSLIAVYMVVERWLYLRKAATDNPQLIPTIKEQLHNGNLSAAKATCKAVNTPISRMLDKGISRIGKPIDVIERSIENVGKVEVYKMERGLNVLQIISGIAPMFGFLGTIAGMIITFYDLSNAKNLELGVIAGGIYVKMITSASGLIVGLFAYVAYNALHSKINNVIHEMELQTIDFLDILQEPSN
jgi:biopolymer transport protein ExbB